ncbi:MAG: TraR/DksA family transcriptional regulator [Acidimicrobiia bacterium]
MDPQHARELLERQRRLVLGMTGAGTSGREGDAGDDIFRDLSSTDQHQADSASETFEQERDATIAQIAREERADIDHALAKLAAGGYGSCETCGVAIPDERLEARPEARFCEVHQRIWELGTIALDLPDVGPSIAEVAEPGWRELDSLPGDDGLVAEPGPPPEESALHLEPADGRLGPEDVEDAEGLLAADLTSEQRRHRRVERVVLADLEATAEEEEQLG